MEAVLCDALNNVTLVSADVVALVLEPNVDGLFERLEGLFFTAKQVATDGIVGEVERQVFDVGDIDERCIYSLEVAGEEAPLPEPFVGREALREFDGNIYVGGTVCVPCHL
jgi:hypothetical protein